MKKISEKIISLIISMCLVATGLPLMVYAKSITPEISLEEFTKQLKELQAEYDGYFASEIIIENGKEFYHVDGEEYPVADDFETTATVTENDIEIPLSAISDYCELPDISTYSMTESSEEITVDKETAEALGFEVEIEEERAVLTQPYQTQRLIVKSQFDINPLDSVAIVEGYNDLHIVQFDSQESAKQAEEYYNSQILVEFAEPDLVMSTMEYEDSEAESIVTYGINDYGYHLSWGSEDSGIDDYIDYIGDRNNLPEIVVGVIDTGIDVDHEFLRDRIIRTNYNISSSGEENDENDDKGHGTHVAGIIVDNTLDNVKIKGYKALNSVGNGTLSDVIMAFDYAVADGVNIINMSLSTEGTSKAFEKSINAATKGGVIVCVSAGNSGHDASRNCPANIESCLTVGAYGQSKEPGYISVPIWSCDGPLVDVVAPGVSIYSTYLDNGYQTLSGTSMACPFVAATSALFMSKDPSINADGVCDLIQENGKTFVLGIKYYVLYIAKITEYDQYRTEKPVFSMESGRYSDSVTVALSCPEENAEIYYTLDGTRASKDNGILYTEPIVIDKVTKVHAAAYAGDKLKSLQAIADYYITVTDPEDNFEIDTNGLIVAYNGTNQYLTIPDTINGITVTGIGTNAFKGKDMVMIKFPDNLTCVGKSAFSGKSTLKSIYSNNLKEVGERAFYGCRALEEIDLTQLETVSEYAFFRCTSIQSVYNEKMTRIEKFAFNGLTSAVSVDFPNVEYVAHSGLGQLLNAEYIHLPNVKTLSTGSLNGAVLVESLDFPELTTIGVTSGGGGCFEGTHNLKEFKAPKLTGTLPTRTFVGSRLETVEFPNVTSLAEEAFYFSCLKTIILPNVTTVGESAFSDCHYLEELYIPSATEISSSAFKNCKSLKSIALNSAVSIGSGAFSGCASLENIELPDSVTSVSGGAFNGCTSLENIEVDVNNSAYSSVDGVLFNKEHTEIIRYPIGKPNTSYDIPNSVTNICSHAFSGCMLTSIKIPNSVTSVESWAFSDCTALTSINLPNSVTSVEFSTFSGCTALEEIRIPKSVTNIDSRAFYGCTSLKNIMIPESTKIGALVFGECKNVRIIGFYGTPAKSYAEDNGFGFCRMGDIDGNGTYDANDYAMLAAQVKCQAVNTSAPQEVGDINWDGTVDAFDAIQLDLYVNRVTDIHGNKLA